MSGEDSALDDAVVVALGSNLAGAHASRKALLESALMALAEIAGPVRARSSWWSSRAWPDGSGPDFLNGVAILGTNLEPAPLLGRLTALEREFGRERTAVNAPRTLDLDLIAFARRIETVGPPILPHPRAAERLFVMGPLAEIAPRWRHPALGLTAAALAAAAPVGRDSHPVAARAPGASPGRGRRVRSPG